MLTLGSWFLGSWRDYRCSAKSVTCLWLTLVTSPTDNYRLKRWNWESPLRMRTASVASACSTSMQKCRIRLLQASSPGSLSHIKFWSRGPQKRKRKTQMELKQGKQLNRLNRKISSGTIYCFILDLLSLPSQHLTSQWSFSGEAEAWSASLLTKTATSLVIRLLSSIAIVPKVCLSQSIILYSSLCREYCCLLRIISGSLSSEATLIPSLVLSSSWIALGTPKQESMLTETSTLWINWKQNFHPTSEESSYTTSWSLFFSFQ